MPQRRVTTSKPPERRRAPATTPEQRENQLIGLATDLAEKQMQDGTASAQVISHYLKLGSSRERLEQERIKMETEMLAEKKEQLKGMARVEELYADAIQAMRAYGGHAAEVDHVD